MNRKTIALAGNPNVGKSTIFNSLTGLNQHTGNWPGKTVTTASGTFTYKDTEFTVIDLPGAYSLCSDSPDEKAAADYIASGEADIILIIADASCLERNLLLVRDILCVSDNIVLCVNLMDEAEKKGIRVDIKRLSDILGIPVTASSARSGEGIPELLQMLYDYTPCLSITSGLPDTSYIYSQCVNLRSSEPHITDRKIDRIVTSKLLGFPIMIMMLIIIFWLTMSGANYPSAALSSLFAWTGEKIRYFLNCISLSPAIVSLIMDGIYTTLTWVISVMLPPMAIFFPLFTILEDSGYLPRIAFNLDNAFKSCGAHGKQALTMCMGFGCNACGVTGCRIIESPRERLIAVLTNCFVPCNGRFPALITLILIFLAPAFGAFSSVMAGVILTFFIISGIIVTLLVSRILSKTLLKGIPSSFVLELPPYRRPQFRSIIIRSLLDRTLFVLGRAVVVAAPAGAIIWLTANIEAGDTSILNHMTAFLEPFGRAIGVDGVIITAFILGFPANEIVIPVMLMCYMSTGTLTDYTSLSQLHETLSGCGWTIQTAFCVLTLCMFHFPCGTTCLTIKKETGSLRWTALAFIIPTVTGICLCFLLNTLFHII
ncbi:MAG: ferrous iron transporter B [Clostridiales bacterium]|nr:ferrous iron transporter B [Clostridiales bacterium]